MFINAQKKISAISKVYEESHVHTQYTERRIVGISFHTVIEVFKLSSAAALRANSR